MDVGETWCYRERINDAACPLVPAEILQFGPPRSHKVRVRMHGGEYPGLDMWVPKVRLPVPWSEADAWLRDEALYGAAREASRDAVGSVEHEAAITAISVHPMPDGILIGYHEGEGAIVEVADLAAVADDLGLDAGALLSEPLAFVDRHGVFVAPWAVARRIAMRVAERHAHLVLAKVDREERELREGAVHGRHVDLSRREQIYIPPERCAERLRNEEPVFELVRAWCGVEAVEKFDEIAALRTEVARLRALIDDTVERLSGQGFEREARRLRKKVAER